MASIVRKGSGWVVRWREGGRGSPLRSSKTFGTKAAASQEAAAIDRQRALAQANGPVSAAMTLAEIATHWLAQRTAEGRARHDYAAQHLAFLARIQAAHPRWQRPADIRPSDPLGTLSLSHWRTLRAILRHAVRLGQMVDGRVLAYRRPPRPRRADRPLLTDDQVAALLAAARRRSPGAELLGHLVATYGHRPESLVHLTAADCTLTGPAPEIRIRVKSGDDVRHPILAATVALIGPLAARFPAQEPLLRDDQGQPWPTGEAAALWWYGHVGRPTTPTHPGIYELKRAAISRWLGLGIDVATIASMTGHRTPAVLLRYARTNADRQRAALNALARCSLGVPSEGGKTT